MKPYMKKFSHGIVYVFILVLIVTEANAQFSKQTRVVGAQGYAYSTGHDYSNNKTANNGYNLILQAGYFFSDHIQAGFGIGTNSSNSNNIYNSEDPNFLFHSERRYNGRSYSIIPYARYYSKIGEKSAFFTELNTSFSFGDQTENSTSNYIGVIIDEETKSNTRSFGTSLTGGLVYFIGKRLGLEASIGNLGYSQNKQTYDNAGEITKSTSSYFNLTFGLSSFNIGAKLYL